MLDIEIDLGNKHDYDFNDNGYNMTVFLIICFLCSHHTIVRANYSK